MTFADYIANLCVGRLLETGLTDMAHLVQELRECAAEITDAEVLSAWVGLHQPNCRPAARDALWGAYESFASIARHEAEQADLRANLAAQMTAVVATFKRLHSPPAPGDASSPLRRGEVAVLLMELASVLATTKPELSFSDFFANYSVERLRIILTDYFEPQADQARSRLIERARLGLDRLN
jgi:hypothetical protein